MRRVFLLALLPILTLTECNFRSPAYQKASQPAGEDNDIDDIDVIDPIPEPNFTRVEIQGEQFYINGELTYKDVTWNGYPIAGLLMNSRMVQGIFDDLNIPTRYLWEYPDTGVWDPDRNTNEFIASMPDWMSHGMLAFTLNLQGGSPVTPGHDGWINSTFDGQGNLRSDYLDRLDRILSKADELGMVVILGLFYFGQDEYLENENAIISAVDNIMDWLFQKGYRNILIEINNECSSNKYQHSILKSDRVHELIARVKNNVQNGYRYLVGTSFGGGYIPTSNIVQVSDFILLHGNNVNSPDGITSMVTQTKQVSGYTPMPIIFNEDNHYDFDAPSNNFIAAVQSYASWGYLDYRNSGEAFEVGFQTVPVDWRISTARKQAFFNLCQEITTGN